MVDFSLNPGAAQQQPPNVLTQLGQMGQIAQQKIAIDTQKYNLAQAHYNTLQQTLGGIAADPQLSPQSVAQDPQAAVNYAADHVQNLVKMGLLDAPGAAQALSQLPTVQQAQANPAALKQYATSAMNQAASNGEQFSRTYAPISAVGNGASTQFVQANPMTGQVNSTGGNAAVIQNQPAPGTTEGPIVNGQPTRTTNQALYDVASGKATVSPTGQIVYNQGQGPNPRGLPNGGTAPVAPVTSAPLPPQANKLTTNNLAPPAPAAAGANPFGALNTGTGLRSGPVAPSILAGARPALPPAPQSTVGTTPQAAAGPAQGQGQVAGQLVPVGAPMGAGAAADVSAAGNANQALALQQAASGSPGRQAALSNLETDSQKFEAGPLADKLAKVKNFVNQAGKLTIGPDSPQWDAEGVAALQSFHKNAALLQQQQASALGSTATALNNAGYTIPDTSNSSLGNTQVISILKGQESALQAKNQAWQQYQADGHTAQDYGKFENQFNRNYDPRIYQLPYMSAADKTALLTDMKKNMTKQQQNDFASKFRYAQSQGYLSPAGQQ